MEYVEDSLHAGICLKCDENVAVWIGIIPSQRQVKKYIPYYNWGGDKQNDPMNTWM